MSVSSQYLLSHGVDTRHAMHAYIYLKPNDRKHKAQLPCSGLPKSPTTNSDLLSINRTSSNMVDLIATVDLTESREREGLLMVANRMTYNTHSRTFLCQKKKLSYSFHTGIVPARKWALLKHLGWEVGSCILPSRFKSSSTQI